MAAVAQTLELETSYDAEADWVSADRTAFTPAPFGLNIDNALSLDFDANGYLSAAEILGGRASFETVNLALPSSSEPAALRLARRPESSGTEEFDCVITAYASPDGLLVQAAVADLVPGAMWFSLGKSFMFALNDGRLASVLFAIPDRASGS